MIENLPLTFFKHFAPAAQAALTATGVSQHFAMLTENSPSIRQGPQDDGACGPRRGNVDRRTDVDPGAAPIGQTETPSPIEILGYPGERMAPRKAGEEEEEQRKRHPVQGQRHLAGSRFPQRHRRRLVNFPRFFQPAETKFGSESELSLTKTFLPPIRTLMMAVAIWIFPVKKLLQRGVSPDSTNEDGLTALHQVVNATAW